MKSWWLFALLVLALTGCVPYEAAPDVRRDVANAQATQGAAEAALQSTQDAVYRESMRSTQIAAATQGAAQSEIDLLTARMEATRQALDIERAQATATQAAVSAQATATQVAFVGQATQAVLAAQMTAQVEGFRATQTAFPTIIKRADEDRAMKQSLQMTGWFFGGMALLIVIWGIVRMVMAYFSHRLKIEWMREAYKETRDGSIVIDMLEDGMHIRRVRGDEEIVDGEVNESVPFSRSSAADLGPTIGGPSEHGGITNLARDLVRDSATLDGSDAKQIASWRRLKGWTSDKWQRAVAALAAAGLVDPRPGVGTYVAGNGCLDDLMYNLESGRVHLRPTDDIYAGLE